MNTTAGAASGEAAMATSMVLSGSAVGVGRGSASYPMVTRSMMSITGCNATPGGVAPSPRRVAMSAATLSVILPS